MNRDPILFRVDATPEQGGERLGRCLTFAAALQRRRRPAYFLSQLMPGPLGLILKRAGHEWLQATDTAGSADDLAETLREVRRLRPAAVVIDAASVDTQYLAEIGAVSTLGGSLLVVVDHLAACPLPVPLVVNPLLAPPRAAYDLSPHAQLLHGERFALVRPELRRIRQARAQEPAPPFRCVLVAGDDDPHARVAGVLRHLVACSRLAHIDVVARATHPALTAIQESVQATHEPSVAKTSEAAGPGRVELATEPAEVAARLARCHFAVSSGGNWSLELACIGIPQLLVVHAESYVSVALRLEEEGAATVVSRPETGGGRRHPTTAAAALRLAITSLLNDPSERQAMSRSGRQFVDGRGPDRLVTALEIMLHRTRSLEAFGAFGAREAA